MIIIVIQLQFSVHDLTFMTWVYVKRADRFHDYDNHDHGSWSWTSSALGSWVCQGQMPGPLVYRLYLYCCSFVNMFSLYTRTFIDLYNRRMRPTSAQTRGLIVPVYILNWRSNKVQRQHRPYTYWLHGATRRRDEFYVGEEWAWIS